jgi:hypothetical protein
VTQHVGTRRWLLAGGLAIVGCGSEPGAEQAHTWFVEVAQESGVDFVHHSDASASFRFPEIMGGGAALFDHDDDGDLDLYLVQSGALGASSTERSTNRLYRNDGAGAFSDVTDVAGVGHDGYGMGVCCGDYDDDGDIDLYVTNVGPNVLYRNNGDGTFTDVSDATGVAGDTWSTSCAFVDLDDDGKLDLIVLNNLGWDESEEIESFNYYGERDYSSPNNYNAALPDALYRNLGAGQFEDVTAVSGLQSTYGNGLGVSCGDFDLDGKIDLYVANDARANQLWRNLGEMQFEDTALENGCAVNGDGRAEAGMGVQFVDIENDGDLDLFMTHLRDESNTFYLNRSGVFGDVTRMTGMLGRSIQFTGFGMGFADFDHDGQLDLFIANGAVQSWKHRHDPGDAYAEPNLLFRGTGAAHFEEVPHAGLGADLLGTSRAAAFGDIDGDGDVDVVVVERDAPVRILRNTAPRGAHAIQLRVLQNGKDAIGAGLEIQAGTSTQRRQVQTAYSYLASNDPRVHVGLGDATRVERVTVTWPGGGQESFGPLAADGVHVLKFGEGRSE